jgi:hypothetical protein
MKKQLEADIQIIMEIWSFTTYFIEARKRNMNQRCTAHSFMT